MGQFLRPDGLVSAGSWTNNHTALDESTPSDADLAYSQNNPNGSIFEVSLSNPSGTPGSGTYTVRYRHAQVNSGVLSGTGTATALDVSVVQGTTVIASDAQQAPSGSWTTRTWAPDLSGISDWSDVRLRFVATGGGGSPANRRGVGLSWAEIEVPDAGGTNHQGAANLSGTATLSAAGDVSSGGGGGFSDDFTGSGTLGARTGWTQLQGTADEMVVASGVVGRSTVAGGRLFYATEDDGATSQSVTVDMLQLFNPGPVIFGSVGGGNLSGYALYGVSSTAVRLYRLNAGAATSLVASITVPSLNAITLQGTVNGSGNVELSVIQGGSTRGTFTDSSASKLTSGRRGLTPSLLSNTSGATMFDNYADDSGGGGGTAHDGAAALSGSAALVAAAARSRTAAAALSGGGALVVAAIVSRVGAAALTGTGSLLVSASITNGGAAILSGAGTVTAAPLVTRPATALIVGTGSLAASAGAQREGSAALAGAGSLSAAGAVSGSETGAAILSGAGTLAVSALRAAFGGTTLTGAAAVAAAGTATKPAQALLSGSATLAPSGTVSRAGAALLAGSGAISAAGSVTSSSGGAAILSGTSALTATARLDSRAAATLGGAGELTAGGVSGFMAAAMLSGSGVAAIAGAVERRGTALLGGSGTMLASGTVTATFPVPDSRRFTVPANDTSTSVGGRQRVAAVGGKRTLIEARGRRW